MFSFKFNSHYFCRYELLAIILMLFIACSDTNDAEYISNPDTAISETIIGRWALNSSVYRDSNGINIGTLYNVPTEIGFNSDSTIITKNKSPRFIRYKINNDTLRIISSDTSMQNFVFNDSIYKFSIEPDSNSLTLSLFNLDNNHQIYLSRPYNPLQLKEDNIRWQ